MTKVEPKLDFCDKEEKLMNLIGMVEIFNIYNKLRKTSNFCNCCGFFPKISQKLKLHIVKINDENPLESDAVLLCEACFYIKHFDKAIEKKLVALVNSEFSQLNLIDIQRKSNKTLNVELDRKRVVILKMKPEEYAKTLREDMLLYSPHIKIVFNNNFNWENCK